MQFLKKYNGIGFFRLHLKLKLFRILLEQKIWWVSIDI